MTARPGQAACPTRMIRAFVSFMKNRDRPAKVVAMPAEPSFVPTGVKAPHGATSMEITWADGHQSPLPHEILRGYCPCARCQGHGGTIRRVDIPAIATALEVREIERVGKYGLSFAWGDGHDTGIYTFKYLRSLCQCDVCKPSFSLGDEEHDHAPGPPEGGEP